MLKELDKFKLEKFSEYLKSGSADDDSVLKIIESTLTRPDIVQIRNNKVRKQRDKFIENLFSLTSNCSNKVRNLIISKAKIIKASEELFDKILNSIKLCDISKESKEIQIWSHLKRVESQFELLYKDLENHLKKHKKTKNKVLSHYAIIENDEGASFSADAASEYLIEYLSITLKLLSYEFKMFDNEKLILPNQVAVSDTNIFQAGSIELLAKSWKELEVSCQRSILFGGDVICCRNDEVQKDARENGIKLSYHYKRKESDYEMFDAISCERVKKISLQNYFEILSNPELTKKISSSIDTVDNLTESSFLSENEILACIILGNIFCVNILEDKKDFNGLTLAEWIRSYSTLQRFSEGIERGKNILSHEFIIKLLEKAGVSKDKGEVFIDLITFSKGSKGSKDLYDCPLIKIENGGYYFTYYSCLNVSVANVILSRFSSLETESSDKGFKFESDVIELVRERVGNCESFKFKRGLDEYEYDAVFTIDNKLFILECKNRSLSWYNPVKAFRNRKYLLETTGQVLRLKDALVSYPKVLQEKLGIDVVDYEIVPVIFNCMPFGWKGTVNNVYVTDYSSFSWLLRSSEINLVVSDKPGSKTKITSKYNQWKDSKICSEDIIHHLDNPIQLIPYIQSRKCSEYWRIGDNETAFTVMNYEVDVPKYERQEINLFTSTPSKTKRRTKNNKQ